ncbi:hypothetical protein [Arthrobacter sp. ISL-30]|uniref:hypothetical protein n=1 Tax=Arthrobacter sp. ISL-30 TaxID=2819109 RepID=UPI001BEBC264|nr:hypothetical protein [Arthrobacter sp. ISL-30]MBT2514833.1 hypothetical protein [Arthrobacter sp. ISL-30]
MSKSLMLLVLAAPDSEQGVFGEQHGAIRGQARAIIEDILQGTAPEEQYLRSRLERCVARHPGRPEEALLEHLMQRDGHVGIIVA